MNYKLSTLPVVKYIIADDDEGTYEADNPADFDETCALLERLREESPENQHTLYAEIDA